MEPTVDWFVNNILPWLFMGTISGFIYIYNEVNRIKIQLTNSMDRTVSLADSNKERIVGLDRQLRKDLADLRADVEYMSRNNVSKGEMDRYLVQLNSVVERITANINKLI